VPAVAVIHGMHLGIFGRQFYFNLRIYFCWFRGEIFILVVFLFIGFQAVKSLI
jgi:hypothetical protein